MRKGIYDGTYHTHPNPKAGRNDAITILVPGWECSRSDCPFTIDKTVGYRSRLGPATASVAGKPAARRKRRTRAKSSAR
jgi:hypothetical protein